MNLPVKKRVTGLILLLLFGLVLVYPVICRPGPATAANPFGNSGNAKVIKRVFPNGLTLLIKPNTANKVVAVDLFVRMGALYEPEKRRGISKLMQRVLIKGTTTRSAKDIVIETESAGASIDAGIMDYGYGNVSLKTTLEGLDTGLKVLVDLLLHPVFPEAEVEKEKQLMIEQLNATEDQPAAAAFQDYLQLFYGNHPIGLPAKAIADRVKNFTRDDLLAWYQKIYIPNNMVISVIGKVDPGVIESLFRETLGKMPARERPEAIIAETPSKSRNQQIVKLRESQALFMVLGFPAPRITDGDYPVMEVINYILGGDMGSRLFMELREKKGLAYDVSTGYNTGDYPGTVFAFMATEPSNYQEARDGLIKEFQRLMVETVPERELTAAKQAVKGAFLMSHETNAGQNRLLARYEILGLGYQQDQRYPGLIEKVTAKDIQIVAKRYFSHYILSMVSPVDIPSLKSSKASFEEGKEFHQD